jgi:Amt family ammonium transporter
MLPGGKRDDWSCRAAAVQPRLSLSKGRLNPQVLLILFAVGALLLQPGFALQSAGVSRIKNASSSILRILVAAAVSTLSFWAIGQSLMTGTGNRWVSINTATILAEEAGTPAGAEIFQLAVAAIGGAIVCSAVAERSRFRVGLVAAAVFAGLVYPVTGRWVWSGWLYDMHFIDFAGATTIHLTAAVIAAIAVAMVGPRARTAETAKNAAIAGHAVPMSTIGVMLIAVGWVPYILGSAIAHATPAVEQWYLPPAAINLMLAGAAGTIGGLIYGYSRYKKPDLFFARAGLLGGLVAISAAVFAVGNIGAACIGFGAGLLVPMLAVVIDDKAGLDDPAGVIAVHGGGAIWGTLMTAVFASNMTSAIDHMQLLAIQCLGIAVITIVAAVTAAVVFSLLRLLGPLRVTAEEEADGLDRSDHGLDSYPADRFPT